MVVNLESHIEKLLPAIREKWPASSKDIPIYIQQDNARPHVNPDDATITAACQRDGWNIKLTSQPPNSPDFNVLDLGFFNSIQSLQAKQAPLTIDELITSVEQAYWSEPIHTTDFIFLSLMKAMESTMLVRGKNKYELQHMQKGSLLRSGELPETIRCSDEAVEAALEVMSSL